ncbi:N-acetyltransferase [Cronobacter sakazakii]|uniref:N-acetyltransferase n=1 Tax=Cronobacter TaxID=413496 RepID=UPI000CFC0B3A|nr:MULTISPECIES: N-acetyltransferase [Cronobacter]EKY3112488.1 N-acetyltransferase [Cronobacter sakazakii]EMC4147508.1 N-acetyltransferase [Cronobacter sakazakii]EME1928524.1 N-acetyltransferase [Cronobacter sakazakii]EME1932204.1 N-acetyltransferase [Cronobacter sakazakii]EME1935642.1 N-acetyltransferase [Cronobacter sakazakii]
MENLKYIPFNQVNFSDAFFDSLKADYSHGFIEWFHSKCNSNDYAYVLYDENDNIDGFLYLKTETGIVDDVNPIIPDGIHLKVGTFKFNPKGTLRGQRFLKKIFDHALNNNVDNIYVTAFEKHDYLIRLFKIYGFIDEGVKVSKNGIERVLIKEMNRDALTGDILSDYPFINNRNNESKFLLSIYPTFHTRLFPDSKLITESPDVISDVSYANSIRKVYICGMSGVESMKPNDIILIYRTSDNQGPAYYRSVATSLCVVEKVRNIHSFVTEKEFVDYCARYSVFTESELKNFYKTKKYPYIISFTYNLALPKRLNRAKLISDIGLNPQAYWGVMKLTNEQFNSIVKLGGVNESIIIN